MKIITQHHHGFTWHWRKGVHVKGYLYDGVGTYRHGEKLLDYFSCVTDEDSFRTKLRGANGCFAAIVESGVQLLAAVDPVRSIPLYYAEGTGDIVLGDDVYAIQQELGEAVEVDPVAGEAFLRVGYTVGPRTLDPRIRQIEAGEIYHWDQPGTTGGSCLYFSHAHGNYTDKNEDVLVAELDQITTLWARRLIASVEGRTIVIPLSGGYDSRYIACALKREGYANVICYSYGAPASFEWHVAREVALRLGYPIHVVEYNRCNWRATLESPRFRIYCRFAGQRCAVPHIQDLPAFEGLVAQRAFRPDAVVVPGFCGDLQGGSYIPAEAHSGRPNEPLAEGINNYLLRTLFNLQTSELDPVLKIAVLRQIDEYTSHQRIENIQDFCSVLEDWFTRHKVAKFVVNALRVYEHYEHEWRLPLWDKELIDWWYQVPLRHRLNSRLYHRFLFERIFEPMKVAIRKREVKPSPTSKAKRMLPAALLSALRWINRHTLATYSRKRSDINAFDHASKVLLKQLPSEWHVTDFGNVNGAVAVWCDANGI